jgi:hypothetical protein
MFVELAHEQEQKEEEVEEGHIEQVHLQTPDIRRGGRGGGDDGGERRREGERAQPSGRIAFANYENAFLLCGARNAAAFLRRTLSGGSEDAVDRDSLLQRFWMLESPEPILLAEYGLMWPFHFGIYEPSARSILKSAAENRLSPPSAVELAIAPVGTPRDLPRRDFVMQGDGLAFFNWPPRYHSHRTWDLDKGDWV